MAGKMPLQPRAPKSATNSAPSSRSATPKPYSFDKPANDHTISFRPRMSQKEYPPDCPPLNVRWYYAVDVPKSTTFPTVDQASKPPKQASKYVPFGARDSHAIESVFLKLAESEEAAELASKRVKLNSEDSDGDLGERPGPKQQKKEKDKEKHGFDGSKIPVNEDYLFDVDIIKRELAPVYWLGPAYDVRRGTWFYQEGSTLRPCDENLATQLEDGYLVVKPFRKAEVPEKPPGSSAGMLGSASENLAPPPTDTPTTKLTSTPHATWRLFGAHMNSFVVFADAQSAWLMTDDFYGKLSSTLYQRISSGQHMGGIKLVRGYSEGAKSATEKKPDISSSVSRPVTPTPEIKALKAEVSASHKRKSMPPPSTAKEDTKVEAAADARKALERHLSAYEGELVGEEQMLEDEMNEDYKHPDDVNSEDQGREIEHLLLTTHGIGQRLSERLASVNFVHDVNVFRQTFKSVYGYSPNLQAFNDELREAKKNCRIQCLPVCWRHLVDFPERSIRHSRNVREHDLGSGASGDAIEEEYPSLADITVEGVPAVRSLITDLALDILLYQSPTYKEHIAKVVLEECNRIYALFKKRNPGFRGKVSLVGHSLGSVILFDLLCTQPDKFDGKCMGFKPTSGGKSINFDFPVENLFCLGSPIGLFQMLKGRTIAARTFRSDSLPAQSPIDPEYSHPSEHESIHRHNNLLTSFLQVSSPACRQLFNIFHPTDPISYRIEPLVSRAMADLKPQPLPYTKRGLWTGTAQLAGGITGIGQSVTKSVSGLWSSLSSGIASSLLNRSLGFTDAKGGEVGEREFEKMRERRRGEKVMALSVASTMVEGEAQGQQEEEESDLGHSAPTLIDDEIETLYEGFQKRRKSAALIRAAEKASGTSTPSNKDSDKNSTKPTDLSTQNLDDDDLDVKADKLKHEEAKVRALNATGRIDFAIQEGVFDLSLISSLASHLGYWNDEDVAHFIISQLLARRAGKQGKDGEESAEEGADGATTSGGSGAGTTGAEEGGDHKWGIECWGGRGRGEEWEWEWEWEWG
ncbi:DDHD-domain-containing protein [Terfezia boudieri ATCC MYA-4762]|uniref:DDHD-domain-containing protein n=1 Tax=Terfezia boudieri ATCC MYA-4762 TaxID=1051890 RepID=A0A3N4M3M8_9PEZI|nr:DDHD-domain-containing protein [Terfezia boudieri ATCC MYA-4762]